MRILLCLLLFAFSVCFGAEFRLKDRFAKAQSGDYIVTEAGKMITLLSIRSVTPRTVVLEEISTPTQNLKDRPPSWPEWVKAKAPGHTSWSMIEIDIQNGEIVECYSFSRATWVHLSQKESLIATLLHLPLKPIASSKRKKIGPPPMDGERDYRKFWNPPLVFEGKAVENSKFDVLEAIWPEDGSDLSKKEITLYFNKEKKFPFPFWIQVETSHLTAALRTIDSGQNLPLVHRTFPHRIPEFVGLPVQTQTGLRLCVKSPKYYRDFELFAIDATTKEKQIHPLNHSICKNEGECIQIEVERAELESALQAGHRYTWLLVPSGHTESYTQLLKPFTWLP